MRGLGREVTLGVEALAELAPFVIVVDQAQRVRWTSPPLARRFPDLVGRRLDETSVGQSRTRAVYETDHHRRTLVIGQQGTTLRLEGRWVGTAEGRVFLGHPDLLDEGTLRALTFADLPFDDASLDLLVLRDEQRSAMVDAEAAIARLAEKRAFISTILQEVPVCLMVVDVESHEIVLVNEMTCALFGAPPEQIVGRECQRFVCVAERGRCPVTDSGLELHQEEKLLVDVAGQSFPVLKTVVPVTLEGRPRLLEVMIDLRERKRLEAQLVQSRKLEALGQLASGVAHEINTPVQFVNDNLSFFKETLQAYEAVVASLEAGLPLEQALAEADLAYYRGEAPAALDQSLEGMAHISKIIRSMRDLVQHRPSERSLVDLNQLVESVTTVTHTKWQPLAALQLSLEPGLTAVVGSRAELGQVLLNVLFNALQAFEQQGRGEPGHLTISTRREGAQVVVGISDDGPGIPEAIREQIFDPFFTTRDVGQGTGQGLAIAHSVVVDKHGGELSFESEVGVGTTFLIKLPIEGVRR